MLKKIILFFIIGFLTTTIYATSAPILPASYYGTVSVEGGGTLNNVKLIAKINGEERGSIVVKNNRFGGASYSEGKIIVNGNQEDNGKTVEFYIGKYKAKETVNWKSGDIKEISLTFPKEVLNEEGNSNNTSTSTTTYINDSNSNTPTSTTVPTDKSGTGTSPAPTHQSQDKTENAGNPTSLQTKDISISYDDVAKDIKSEKIKEIVHNAKLMIGSDVDWDLSAKKLKNNFEKVKQVMDITEDCILVGGPVANSLSKKYINSFKIKITNEYPGANKGVIQKQIINGHTVILLAGSDRWGTKAAVEYFKTLDDIPSEPIFVEWKDGKAVKIEKP